MAFRALISLQRVSVSRVWLRNLTLYRDRGSTGRFIIWSKNLTPTRCMRNQMSSLSSGRLRLGKQVAEAVRNGEPVVALESTLITHGLPRPQNLSLALGLERIVRESVKGETVVPATVGILRGQLVVGLSEAELEYLADTGRSRPIKASRRDIPIAMAKGLSAGTTVAGTMAIVSSVRSSKGNAPIRIFATGGTGGVHRGGEHSMDISADLFEFSRSPVCVVSSGFKSFLDTRRSLEYLETIGCTVMSLASSESQDERFFPAFYNRKDSEEILSPHLVHSLDEAARVLYHCLEAAELTEHRGALLGVPIPDEFSLDHDELTSAALNDETIRRIDASRDLEGREKTPLILEHLNRVTAGKSLKANMELLNNNARVGAKLAFEYAKMRNIVPGVTFNGQPHLSVGGVGRNLAVALQYLGCKPTFITALGNDELASFAIDSLESSGFDCDSNLKVTRADIHKRSSSCFALVLLDSLTGQCECVIANLDAVKSLDREAILSHSELIRRSKLLVLDANLSSEALECSLSVAHEEGVPIFLEPTDCLALPRLVESFRRIAGSSQSRMLSSLLCLSPNLVEFKMLCQLFESRGDSIPQTSGDESIEAIKEAAREFMRRHLPQLKCLLITMDKSGVLVALRRSKGSHKLPMDRVKLLPISEILDNLIEDESRAAFNDKAGTRSSEQTSSEICIEHFEVPRHIERPVSASGAGDSFAAAFICGILNGSPLGQCIQFGFKGSQMALEDEDTIPKRLKELQFGSLDAAPRDAAREN